MRKLPRHTGLKGKEVKREGRKGGRKKGGKEEKEGGCRFILQDGEKERKER